MKRYKLTFLAGMRDGNKAQTNPIVAATGTHTYVNLEMPFASKIAPAINGKIAIFKRLIINFQSLVHKDRTSTKTGE